MNATQEEWRPVVGFENLYEVSDHGRVRSLDRTVMRKNNRPKSVAGRFLTPYPVAAMGYPTVSLYNAGSRAPRKIHTLALEAFVCPRPDGMSACHNDGNVVNNHLANLRWDTPAENNLDIVRQGRNPNANKTHCIRGHLLDDAYLKPAGGRQCRRCIQEARGVIKPRGPRV